MLAGTTTSLCIHFCYTIYDHSNDTNTLVFCGMSLPKWILYLTESISRIQKWSYHTHCKWIQCNNEHGDLHHDDLVMFLHHCVSKNLFLFFVRFTVINLENNVPFPIKFEAILQQYLKIPYPQLKYLRPKWNPKRKWSCLKWKTVLRLLEKAVSFLFLGFTGSRVSINR